MLHDRINAIDITRGLIIIFIVVINNLFVGQIPLPDKLQEGHQLFYILAGIAYPAFIFMYCITIPFALTKKINEGLTGYEISRHIFARALILITIGVLLVNAYRVDSEETGISGYLWMLLLATAIFMVWNRYQEKENNFFTISGLRLIGLATLVFLVFKFRSGSFENNGSLIPGWWELPGLLGWGFLVAAFSWLALRNSLTGTLSVLILFLILNILNYYGAEKFIDPVKPYFGIILNGYIPLISLSGLLSGIILRKFTASENKRSLFSVAGVGLLLMITGLISQKHLFSEGIYGNPSWAFIATGTTILLFSMIFLLGEVLKWIKPSNFIKPLGINMISVYIIQFFFYGLAGISGINLFFYLDSGNDLVRITGSLAWALIIIITLRLLLKFNVRLKL